MSAALKVTVRPFEGQALGRPLLAFADVAVAGLLEVRGLRVIRGREGPYVTFPTRRASGGGFFEVARPVSDKARAAVKAAVLRAYARKAGKA